jgi:hypothetical protein
MKPLILITVAIGSIVSAVAILALVAGCQTVATNNAEIATSKKEMLLSQAGFKVKTVTTPKQQQQVSLLAVDKVSAVKYQGKLYYVFPTAKKDQILVGKQAQYDAYKQALKAQQANQQAAQQNAQMAAGSPVWVGETAGPRHITVEEFDGFGPLNPMQGD